MQLQYAAVVGEQGRLLKQQYIQEGHGHMDLLQVKVFTIIFVCTKLSAFDL